MAVEEDELIREQIRRREENECLWNMTVLVAKNAHAEADAQRQRADKAEHRADEAERELAELKRQLEELKKTNNVLYNALHRGS